MTELLQTRTQLETALKDNAELREQLAEKVKTPEKINGKKDA